jgi:hypothetical protein
MNWEAIIAVGISCFVLAAAYFLDSFQDKLFRTARPTTAGRAKTTRQV